ncbi:serine/threonine-protein kinase [Sorangium sp. So ce429]
MALFYIEHVRPLDSGGLGTVDVVRVTGGVGYPIGTLFARKRLGPQWANDPGAQARFDREIELLRTMGHTNIVSCMGHYLPGHEKHYLMPLYPRSLRRLLVDHGGAIARDWVLNFGIKVAAALQYAHSMNFIHRDLKPENILLTDTNEPVIADWGLGQFIHQHSKVLDLKTMGPMGTPYYCPMEQWNTGRCEASGDVYSLGLILAEMVAGRRLPMVPPLSGIRHDVVQNDSLGARTFNSIIKKMTQMFATSRHASMAEVILDLTNCY